MEINHMSSHEAEQLLELCIGRILRMGSRPAQDTDADEFDRLSKLAKKAGEVLYVKSGYRGNLHRLPVSR
jgi:LAS superfamily LD-carboxypeptidase LdcB